MSSLIPTTLDEAVSIIISRLSDEDKNWMRATPEATAQLHHGPGTALRNDWKLWEKESPLSQWFRAHGLWHADDCSSVILDAVRARLLDQPFDLAAEVAHYTAFWRESGLAFDGVPIPGHVEPKSYRLIEGKDGKWSRLPDRP